MCTIEMPIVFQQLPFPSTEKAISGRRVVHAWKSRKREDARTKEICLRFFSSLPSFVTKLYGMMKRMFIRNYTGIYITGNIISAIFFAVTIFC